MMITNRILLHKLNRDASWVNYLVKGEMQQSYVFQHLKHAAEMCISNNGGTLYPTTPFPSLTKSWTSPTTLLNPFAPTSRLPSRYTPLSLYIYKYIHHPFITIQSSSTSSSSSIH